MTDLRGRFHIRAGPALPTHAVGAQTFARGAEFKATMRYILYMFVAAGACTSAYGAQPPAQSAAPPRPIAAQPWSGARVQAAINRNIATLTACVQSANPGPGGATLTLRWMVGRDGTPLATAVTRDTLGDPGVRRCVEAEAATWRFPSPPTPQAVVTWSMQLRAG